MEKTNAINPGSKVSTKDIERCIWECRASALVQVVSQSLEYVLIPEIVDISSGIAVRKASVGYPVQASSLAQDPHLLCFG